jgi:hypothetical protein
LREVMRDSAEVNGLIEEGRESEREREGPQKVF